MKGRRSLKLPIDDELAEMLERLIKQNQLIRNHYKQKNNFIFITRLGTSIIHNSTANAFSKQLSKYAQKYGSINIAAHAIRGLYTTNLLKKNVPVTLISKALGHGDLSVTTQYLSVAEDEVAENLRKYL